MTEFDSKIDELRALTTETPHVAVFDTKEAYEAHYPGFVYPIVESETPPMSTERPELPAYILAALAVIGIVVLTLHGDSVPDILNVATLAALGVGGALTTPRIPKA